MLKWQVSQTLPGAAAPTYISRLLKDAESRFQLIEMGSARIVRELWKSRGCEMFVCLFVDGFITPNQIHQTDKPSDHRILPQRSQISNNDSPRSTDSKTIALSQHYKIGTNKHLNENHHQYNPRAARAPARHTWSRTSCSGRIPNKIPFLSLQKTRFATHADTRLAIEKSTYLTEDNLIFTFPVDR